MKILNKQSFSANKQSFSSSKMAKFLCKVWGFRFVALLLFIPLVVITQAFSAHSRVNLLTTDNFAVLGGSGISDTGTTAIVGDVGLSPTGGTAITGLTCEEVTGTIYDTNGGYTGGGAVSTACRKTDPGLLITAKADLVTAYNDAASRTTTSQIATELGGTTLTDGTYDSADGTFELTGTVTLNGQGNANAVFIFKMASTLTTASNSRVILTNGAQACNVYWQVGSSATLGTGTNLIGNVLALTSITDNGGSTVLGRLLARNGAVTLNNTNVVTSACAAGTSGSSTVASATDSSGGTSTSTCPPVTFAAPMIIDSRRVDSDSVFISWGPYVGTNTFTLQYGTEHGKWLYTNNVTGFSTTLNGLPVNQPIWVRVAARNDCAIGAYGASTLVGGPALPNTGRASSENNFPFIPAGILAGASILFVLTRRKNAF